jgi:hypothetical protein
LRSCSSATGAATGLPTLSLLALLSGYRDRKLSGNSHRADRHHHHNSSECASSAYWNPMILYCHVLLPVSEILMN